MSEKNAQRLNKAITLRDALASDAETIELEQARADLIAAGENPDQVAEATRSMAMDLVAKARKERLAQARQRMASSSQARGSGISSGWSATSIRRALSALAAQPDTMAGARIAVAHRNGKAQSDSDLQSLWEDLLELGAVSDSDLDD